MQLLPLEALVSFAVPEYLSHEELKLASYISVKLLLLSIKLETTLNTLANGSFDLLSYVEYDVLTMGSLDVE